jgi:hypothetical protein
MQDNDAREQRLNELSQELTNMLFILFRSAGLYDLDNQALDQAYEGMIKAVAELSSLTQVSPVLRVLEGNIFINRKQVKLDFSTFQNVRALLKIFELLDINELTIEREVRREDLHALLRAFVRIVKERKGSLRDETLKNIKGRKLKIGTVHPLLRSEGQAERVCAWFAIALHDTRAFYLDAAQGRLPAFAQLKRVALTLVDLPPACAPMLSCVHLITPHEARGTLSAQAVEAAALCVSLSLALSLGDEATYALAFAALQLFQGWTWLEGPLALKVGDPKASRLLFERLEGAQGSGGLKEVRRTLTRKLIELGGVNESVIQRVVMVYEAQRAPQSRRQSAGASRPSRLSRAEALYGGGLTQGVLSDLVYGAHLYVHLRGAHGSHEAVNRLKRAPLSALALSVFEQVLGSHPVGAMVTLSDGGEALVLQSVGGQPRELMRCKRTAGRLSSEDRLTLRPSSPIQIQGAGPHEPTLCAPLIFSHRTST